MDLFYNIEKAVVVRFYWEYC